MKHEWLMLHDLMAESVLGLVTYIQAELGDDGVQGRVGDAGREGLAAPPRRDPGPRPPEARRTCSPRPGARTPAAASASIPGAFTITEDDEKITFTMNPCGSGQRLVRKGLYESQGYGTTHEAHDWSYGRKNFPLYCTHCSFMNEKMPIEWSGYPLYPSDPPEDFDPDPCTWYWYKERDAIPERHWERYGAVKPEPTKRVKRPRHGRQRRARLARSSSASARTASTS